MPSCTSNNKSATNTATIRFWHFWSEPNQRTVIRELIAQFERSHNTTVELTELSWNDGKAKLQAAFNSGSPPDVIELGSDWIAQFSSAGVLMPLPSTATVVQQYEPYTLMPAMWDGKLFAYPWTVDTRVLFVNKDLLAASGWKGAIGTVEQMLQAAEMVKEHGADGFGANGADAHRLYKKILPFIWTNGGDVVNSQGKVTLDQPSTIAAFKMYADLARTGIIETQRQLDAAFLQQKVAFWMSGSWLIPKIKAAGINAEAVLMPGSHGKPGISFAGGEYLAVSAATSNTQRSRELVEFLTSATNALKLCSRIPEAGFPANKAATSNPALLANSMKLVFSKQLLSARMTPVHAHWLDIEALLEDALVRVLLGQATAEESLAMAQAEAQQFDR